MSTNVAVISGRLTRDPEARMAGEASVTEIGVAVNYNRKKGDEWVEEVSFIDVSVWGKRGEQLAAKGRKGDQVTVTGRIQQDRWETAEGNRSKVFLVAQNVEGELFFRKADGSDTPAAEAPAPSDQASTPAADDDIPF